MTTPTAYGYIKVAGAPSYPGEPPLNLTFTDRKTWDDAREALRRAKFDIVDEFFGFEICQSADAAVRSAEFWRGKRG